MKKTLIALAAVAATSASFAQSTVTLSGTVDVGIEKRWSGDPVRMTPNRNGTSNWTLSGAEDLGGGLKAVFQISTAFNSDNGTVTTTDGLGNNGMFVGLTGGFGTLRAGRPVNTLYGNALLANGTKGVSGHDATSVLGGFAPRTATVFNPVTGAGANIATAQAVATRKAGNNTLNPATNAVYVANGLQYHSPRFAGVQVQLEYAPSEVTGAKAGSGIAVRYDGGPISASLTNYTAASASAAADNKSVTQVAGAYDFGVAKLFMTYRDQSGLASSEDNSFAIGATAPVGPGALYVSYNVNEQTGDDGKTVIAGFKYNLSKRTQAYVQLANRNAAWLGGRVIANAAGNQVPTGSSNGYGFGLQHNF